MMEYEVFKNVILQRLEKELPPVYSDYTPEIHSIKKINQEKEALCMIPPEGRSGVAIPNIYLDDMYAMFQECESLDLVMEQVIRIIINFTGIKLPDISDCEFHSKLDRIVMNLVGTERNSRLLEAVPHTDVLDLSIIYRFIMCQEGDGFGTVVLTNEIMKDLGISHDELHQLAHKNTLRLFPPKITEPIDNFFMMTNMHTVSGATTMICQECTDKLAEKIKKDFFIIPASIHEVYAVPAEGRSIKELICTLEEGNRLYTAESEVLSNSIYFYDIDKKSLSIAASYAAM